MTKNARLPYLVLGLLFAWTLTSQIVWSWYAVEHQRNRSVNLDLPFRLADYSTRISALPREYQQSGLRVDDEVVALDGEALTGERQLSQVPERLHPGTQLKVMVRRTAADGSIKPLTILIRMTRRNSISLGWTTVISLSILFPVSCLLVAFYIAFARPTDPLAWITMAMLATFGHIATVGTPIAAWSPLREMLLIYQPITQTWPLWLVLFALYFPIPFQYLQRRRWIYWASIVPFAALSLTQIYANLVADRSLASAAPVARLFTRLNQPLFFLYTSYIGGFFALLGTKKHLLPTNDARRRMSVMIAGCTFALLPIFPVALSENGYLPRLPPWVLSIGLIMLLMFPATMAYVIVVQQAMDVRMVVRAGVQYAIASNGLKILRIVLLVTLGVLTLRLATQSNHQSQAIIIAAAGTALIFGLRNLAERASAWMDRKFFREAYDSEIILTELSSSVASIHDVRMLVETVARRIASSLHISQVAVLLDRDGTFQSVYSMGYEEGVGVAFPRSASTVRLLRQMGSSPSRIYFEDPQSWVHGAPLSEQAKLRELQAEILLPVTLKSRMLGLISLGPKRSEAPYSRVDLQLLGAVASQTGLALENAELTENIRREIAQRERSDRELEIAREVQQRLFPQTLPTVRGLDFAGYCRPALGVGGDYYDFIRLPEDCLGVAIGDVSGKGIAAALMMASLQASLRGQIISPCPSLAQMIQHVNHLVFEASATNRYATFFYAQYDPASRLMHYVNAGHNPPMVYRKTGSGSHFHRLETGGTVIGLFADFPYQEGTLQLEQGDLFVGFTDGISEAMDRQDEEFSEERLMETVRQCEARSAAEIVTCLLDQVDAFTAGAPQHDDMTLVVMRMQ